MLCYSILCAVLIGLSGGRGIAVTAAFAVVIFLLLLLLRAAGIERKYSTRIATDKTGIFDNAVVIEFFERELKVERENSDSVSTIEYDRIYRLYESRDYLLFYYNADQASIIRKADVEPVDALIEFLKQKFGEKYKRIPFEM